MRLRNVESRLGDVESRLGDVELIMGWLLYIHREELFKSYDRSSPPSSGSSAEEKRRLLAKLREDNNFRGSYEAQTAPRKAEGGSICSRQDRRRHSHRRLALASQGDLSSSGREAGGSLGSLLSSIKLFEGLSEEAEYRGPFYECVRCGAKVPARELFLEEYPHCNECGCKILRKLRPPIVKRIKAP